MTRDEEREYTRKQNDERRRRIAEARAEGCPPGWEEEWRRSGKFRMMVADGRH